MNQASDIKVSIVCITYNHVNYIKRALDSFLNQETNFEFEIIIHDDASTDGTTEIIREYEKKYPEIIKPIYELENQYSQNKMKTVDIAVLTKIRGDYFACCEGDDCWTDRKKLQIQYDALQKHPECGMSSHYAEIIDVSSGGHTGYLPNKKYNLKDGVVPSKTLMDIAVFDLLHVSSWFFRKSIINFSPKDVPKYMEIMPGEDMAVLIFVAEKSQCYFINRVMSEYHMGTSGSWTQKISRNVSNYEAWKKRQIESLILCKEFVSNKYIKIIDQRIINDKVTLHVAQGDYRYALGISKIRAFRQFDYKLKIKCMVSAIFPKLPKQYDQWKSERRK